MADVACSSPETVVDPALAELGDPFPSVTAPARVRLSPDSDELTPLWTTGIDSAEDIRQSVLGWLGRNSTHCRAASLSETTKHLVFTLPNDARCFTLRAGPGISRRRKRGRARPYFAVVLGRSGGDGARKRSVVVDAHRPVCSLKNGPSTRGTIVAQHRCHNK